MTDKKFIVKTFNTHLSEFIDDVISVFPREVELLTSRTFINGVMKVKPKIIIQYWYQHIYLLYKKQIDESDFDFFLKKDYNNDVVSNDVLNGIEKMRVKIAGLSDTSREMAVKYAKNLSKLAVMYFE
tara:strand:+ start:759 stop:1139 length:381 start_codon:yes stop_codon:yes gene_type:complete